MMELPCWAYVQVLGHNSFSGKISEEEIAGTKFIRLDTPENASYEAFTKYIHPNSIYIITPCSEEQATEMADDLRASAFPFFSACFRKAQEKNNQQPGPEDIPF